MKLKQLIIAGAFSFTAASCSATTVVENPQNASLSEDAVSVFESSIYRDLFGTKQIRSVFSDSSLINHWLTVEVALAKSQSDLGIIPKDAYVSIRKAAETIKIDYDKFRAKTNKVGRGIKPLIGQLKKHGDENVSSYLHFGSTTQDIMDTATAMQVRQAATVIRKDLVKLILEVSALAEKHKKTVMIARSNGQDAIPTTFGLHLTTYVMELYRNLERLDEARGRLRVQIGSTVGTLAPFGDKGLALQEAVATELGMKPSLAPWNPSRDVFAEMVQTLAMIDTTMGRLALDVNNLSRTQIRELQEGEGGASSTMPQKRNPRASEFMGGFSRMGKMYNSAALDIMSHTDARQGSPWILEWSIIPESFMVTASSIDRARRMFDKLIVNKKRMRDNFAASGHFVMSEAVMNKLTAKLGRSAAYSMVKKAIKGAAPGDSLEDVIRKTPALSKEFTDAQLKAVLNPDNYLGSSEAIVDRTVKMVRGKLK